MGLGLSRLRWFGLGLVVLVLVVVSGRSESIVGAQSRTAPSEPPNSALPPKIEPSLLKQILEGSSDDQFRCLIELVPQADVNSLPRAQSRHDRRQLVATELRAIATDSQADLLAFLEARQAENQVQQIRPFWIFNGIAVTANADTLLAIAARPEVRLLREDRWRLWVEPAVVEAAQPQPESGALEWNIARVRADLAWNALGLDGTGVTLAIMDTGVDWQHPALLEQYRGYKPGGLAIHHGNWYCATDEGYLYPVDAHGHGTHVTGIAVGRQDSAGTAIGVAPSAQWIAVKMLNDAGYGYDSWIHAAFEWLLAPAGEPALAPDIVNGSWGGSDAANGAFRPDLQALRAAGIVPIFAAGNEGPSTSSLRSPGSYPEVITVGATDNQDKVATFSSRGPSPWNEIKPELVAPGVGIRSSLPGGTYGARSGSSMAVPHVTGLVALLLQADPALTAVEIENILTTTAVPLAEQVPNNESGWGRVDSYRAAATAMRAGHIAGQITRHPDREPLSIAQVSASDHQGTRLVTLGTDDSGHYRMALPPGQYRLDFEAFGYAPQTEPAITVQTAITTTVDRTLTPLPTGVLWGQVTDAETSGPVGAELRIADTPAVTTSDPHSGRYSLALPAGTYSLQVSKNGYRRHTTMGLDIIADQPLRLDIALAPAVTLLLVDSGEWYYGSKAGYFEQALDDGDYVYDRWTIRDLSTDLPGPEDLRPYEVAIWSSPFDAPGLIGTGDVISDYLSFGGNLFLTGQDIGYWDDGLSGFWHPYYQDFLKARAVADDAGRADVLGAADGMLHGLRLPVNGPDSAQDQSTPDQIRLADGRGAAIAASYADGGDAATWSTGCQSYRAVYLAAGLEGLGGRATRAEAMDRVLTWLATPPPAVAAEIYPPHQDQVWLETQTLTYTVELQNTGGATDRFDLQLAASAWPASVWDGTFSQMLTQSMDLSPCATQTLGLKVRVPQGVAWNASDTVTLTARSLSDPSTSAQATFSSKAPAPILLVEDQRWYDNTDRYRAALEANGLPYDLWSTRQPPFSDITPSSEQLRRYPLVVWFTGYDWYRTLTPQDEANLAAYLDGGGRLLLTSQDYLYTNGLTNFAHDYLGVAGYTEDLTATQVVAAVGSPLAREVNPIDLYYPFANWSDALRFSAPARPAFWGQHGQPVALTLQQAAWKTAFFAFPLEATPSTDLAHLMGQAVGWLSPLGDSSLAGDREVAGPGSQVAYTLEILNSGPRSLDSVSLSNTLPLSASYVAGSLEGPASYDQATRRFLWSGPLTPGQAVTVHYRLQLDPSLPAGSTIRNVMHLRDESGLFLERVAASRVGAADLSASAKTISGGTADVGEVLTYTIHLINDGLSAAPAKLIDPWPPYTLPLAGSAWASGGQITTTEQALEWRGSIPPGEATTLHFAVVPQKASRGLYAYNRAGVDDGWGARVILEAFTCIEARLYLPLILR